MKHFRRNVLAKSLQSPPAWGAWIETPVYNFGEIAGMSPPAWGAWIETLSTILKLAVEEVASRVGGVD